MRVINRTKFDVEQCLEKVKRVDPWIVALLDSVPKLIVVYKPTLDAYRVSTWWTGAYSLRKHFIVIRVSTDKFREDAMITTLGHELYHHKLNLEGEPQVEILCDRFADSLWRAIKAGQKGGSI